LEFRAVVAGALQREDFLLGRLDAEVPERRLVVGLQALAGDGDADATRGEQRHGSHVDLAAAGNGAIRLEFAAAETRYLEAPFERRDAIGTRVPAEKERDLRAFARRVRVASGLRIAQKTEHGALRIGGNQRFQQSG